MSTASRSFKWRLVRWLVIFEVVASMVVIAISVGVLWGSGALIDGYENGNIDVLRDAIGRDANGQLILRETPDLVGLRREVGRIWFVARDRIGGELREGAVPTAFAFATNGLQRMNEARFRLSPQKDARPEAIVKWVDAPAGRIQIFTGTEGQLTASRLLIGTSGAFLAIFLPMLLMLALATIVVTPLVVKRMLAGLSRAATDAGRIEFDRPGTQMAMDDVPAEFMPLVKAVNDALARLDESYTRHKRFLAQAAHELRTPIAILSTRVAALPSSDQKARLTEDASRLTVLAGQLLDLQRLDRPTHDFSPVELCALTEAVVADLAPLAFAAGYAVSFECPDGPITIAGDQSALERAVMNLVQNAIDHGGRRGEIAIRVTQPARIDVCDEGDGIAAEERERIFEPFGRCRSDGRGAGLGLSLVRQIVQLHQGQVSVTNGRSGGACFRIDLLPI